ncbi:13945_t:CDS:2, partial [Funneliformis geosporum]
KEINNTPLDEPVMKLNTEPITDEAIIDNFMKAIAYTTATTYLIAQYPEDLIDESFEPNGHEEGGGIDIKVEIDGTNFVIQSKNWKRKLYPAIVREMDGMLTRQKKGTVGVIVAPNVNRFTRGMEETANTLES